VRSGPGEARTILLLDIISSRPSKQPLMVRTFLKVYTELGSYFVSARTNKRHHHHQLAASRLPRSWRWTCKPNSLHTMAPDPHAMNHPGDVLTIRRFVFDWLGFYSFVLRLCTEEKCTFGQVHHGEQSLQPSHHGDNALRLRNLHWCPPLKTRTDSHFFLFFRNAPITQRSLLICDSYPPFLCLCIYSTYFLALHIFLPCPHFGLTCSLFCPYCYSRCGRL
jgi:hypothetical protein